jgi:Fic/DOC family
MSMHSTLATPEMLSALTTLDCWNVNKSEIAKLSALVIGNAHMPQLRHGSMSAIIVGKLYGGAANRLSDEFQVLGQQCSTIRADTDHSELTAIVFFHLRFGGIHPLVDSNGRVGRLLLSEQIRRKFLIENQTTLDFLHASQSAYRAAFAPPAPRKKFVLLSDLLKRLVGEQIDTSGELPFPITPTYPDKRPLLDSMKFDPRTQNINANASPFPQRAITIGFKQTLKKTM